MKRKLIWGGLIVVLGVLMALGQTLLPYGLLIVTGVTVVLMIVARYVSAGKFPSTCGYPVGGRYPAVGATGLLLAAALFGCAWGQWDMIQHGTVSQLLPAFGAAILAIAAGICCAMLYGPQLVNEGFSCSQPLLYLGSPLFLCVLLLQVFVEFSATAGHTCNFVDLVPSCVMLLFFFYHGRCYTFENGVYLRRARMWAVGAATVGLTASVMALLSDFGVGDRTSSLPVMFHLLTLAQSLFALSWLLEVKETEEESDKEEETQKEEETSGFADEQPEAAELYSGLEEKTLLDRSVSSQEEQDLTRVLEDYKRKKRG
mgnify:CR=1 FL=1